MLGNSRLIGAIAALLPAVAGALGLGEAHVTSALNQPLNATIEMLAAAPEDLKDLTVALAPRDVFERQGIDRPAFLNDLAFKVSRNARGEPQVEVHSAVPVTEPFLTFLIAIDWPRGHLVREYTLLLDPPVFEAKPSAPTAVVAPATGVGASAAGAVERSAREPASTGAAASTNATLEHTVQAGETLSSVIRSQGFSAAADVNRALIATFRANPTAFDGNMNRLHRGAILRLPPQSEWSQLGVDEATAEVHRQVGSWKGEPAPAHLRLVVPKEVPHTPQPAAVAPDRAGAELAEMRRLLELKNAELARLQAEVARKSAPVPPPATPSTSNPSTPSPVVTPPVTSTPAPVVAPPVTAPAARKHTSTPVVPVSEPGLLDSLAENALSLVGAVLGILVLVLVGLKMRARRLQNDTAGSTELPPVELGGGFASVGDPTETHPRLSATPRADFEWRQRIEVTEDDGAEGEEFHPPPFNSLTTQAIPHSATPGSPPLDSRLGAESSITLHHMDPLAEADFHIAYGLYAQAADILKLAIDLDPKRADLKLKLLEVHFVAGDSAAFLSAARGFDRAQFDAVDWDRVVVMGRQLAPQDPLFAGPLTVSTGMDLDLDTGGADSGLDFEIADGDTVVPSTPKAKDERADFHLDLEKDLLDLSATLDPATLTVPPALLAPTAADDGQTRSDATSEIELEDLGIPEHVLDALPSAAPSESDTVLSPRPEEPTRLMPALGATGPTPAGEDGESAEELLAEASRLLANLWPEKTVTVDPSQSATVAMPPLPPMGSGPASEEIVLSDEPEADDHPTASVPVVAPSARPAAEPSVALSGLRLDDLNLGDEPLEFDLDDLARALQDDTLAQPMPERSKFTTDMLATGLHVLPPPMHAGEDESHLEDDVSRSRTNDLDLPDLDPVTLSEVGTKLDLARAYLDMGDPDGARAILEEVLSEGSPSQKSEAQRLVETLPG
jgi:pilus assembly protein FimV